jgi:hypothetical protein
MAGAAGSFGIGKLARKSNQSVMRVGFQSCRVVAGMTSDATVRGKGMRRAETLLLCLMALQAGAACCLAIVGADTRAADQDRYGKKTERESVQHVAATLARPAH